MQVCIHSKTYSMLIALSVIVLSAINSRMGQFSVTMQWNNRIQHESEHITPKFINIEKLTKLHRG